MQPEEPTGPKRQQNFPDRFVSTSIDFSSDSLRPIEPIYHLLLKDFALLTPKINPLVFQKVFIPLQDTFRPIQNQQRPSPPPIQIESIVPIRPSSNTGDNIIPVRPQAPFPVSLRSMMKEFLLDHHLDLFHYHTIMAISQFLLNHKDPFHIQRIQVIGASF
ncbi:hypothetical protein CEXT_671391 [Caerostris extrusa]|uniref:Uncharacterized protein n=1 Tax=Caerostris extrusa TaxID=172846 RepID=A0AAV4WTH2_CAEEX|nr:hypothetical protein CEXT_671391 [Caerostris extrusa]